MNEILVEEQFGTGLVHRDPQPEDHVFGAGLAEPFDWYKGYDLRNELKKKLGSSFKMPINNQYQTKSCVGQAWSKYAAVKKVMGDPNPNWVEFSPRDVYSHIYLPSGGAMIMDGGLFCKNGLLPNEQLPPYWSGKPNIPPTEEVMRDRGLEGGLESGDNANPHIYDTMRQLVKGGQIQYVNEDIDSIAIAIRDNHGCVIGVYGENNGTWLTKFPKVGAFQWGHALYAIGAIYINGKKYIIVTESWGNGIGDGGYQLLGEEWFDGHYVSSAYTWNPNVGDIVRVSDYNKVYDYLLKNDWFNKPTGTPPYDTPENWKHITYMNGVNMSSSDFNTYCKLKELV